MTRRRARAGLSINVQSMEVQSGDLVHADHHGAPSLSVGIVHYRFDTPMVPRIMIGCLNNSSIFSRILALGWGTLFRKTLRTMPCCQPGRWMMRL